MQPAHRTRADLAPSGHAQSWQAVPEAFRRPGSALPSPWEDIFGPLREGSIDDLVVVGQCGQSIDARIATPSGDSYYINGEAGLDHLHRLRALVDAVVIGVATAIADDPRLTVRRVTGPNPTRVVIDPSGRLPAAARALVDDGARRVVVCATGSERQLPEGVEAIVLSPEDGRLAPATILRALAERGLRRILVEGGAATVSRFLMARCLDRLHVLVAPIILGAGRPSFTLPAPARMAEAQRLPMRTHVLGPQLEHAIGTGRHGEGRMATSDIGSDVLLDCDLSAQRVPVGRAKKST